MQCDRGGYCRTGGGATSTSASARSELLPGSRGVISRQPCPRIPQAAHRAGHALRLIVDPSAAAAVHLGACLLQRPRGHGVRVGQPTLGAKLAGSLQLSDEQSCSVVVETGRHPVRDHIPHRVRAQQVRRERGDGLEAVDIGRMPAVDITLGQRCCGHAPDRATAGTYPQPLSASKCPCWWPRLRCRAGDVSESGGLTGGCIPAAVV